MSGALKGAGKRVSLRDITCDDVKRGSEPRLRTYRVPGEDAERQTLVLKALRYEKARTSRTTDYNYKLVETHAVGSGLTECA